MGASPSILCSTLSWTFCVVPHVGRCIPATYLPSRYSSGLSNRSFDPPSQGGRGRDDELGYPFEPGSTPASHKVHPPRRRLDRRPRSPQGRLPPDRLFLLLRQRGGGRARPSRGVRHGGGDPRGGVCRDQGVGDVQRRAGSSGCLLANCPPHKQPGCGPHGDC